MPLRPVLLFVTVLITACSGSSTQAGVSSPTSPASPTSQASLASTGAPTTAVAITSSSSPVAGQPAVAGVSSASPCVHSPAPAAYKHVIEVWLENRSYTATVGTSGWPTLTAAARRCGSATRWFGASHPSLPNYLAADSGGTGGVSSDCGPAQCPQRRPSLGAELNTAHRSVRTYAGSSPAPCTRVPAGRYAPKHVAALYFADVAGTCRRDVVSLSAFGRDLGAGRLPSLAVVVPDLCDDGHDCSDRHADGWLGGFLRQVVASRSYRAGDTAVLVTFDEGGGGFGGQNCPRVRDESCHVALVALAPSVRAGTRMTVLADHRALPRLVEDLLVLQVHLAASSRLPRVRAALGL